jgi:hypothetical protein
MNGERPNERIFVFVSHTARSSIYDGTSKAAGCYGKVWLQNELHYCVIYIDPLEGGLAGPEWVLKTNCQIVPKDTEVNL